jgi:hypothetical protein
LEASTVLGLQHAGTGERYRAFLETILGTP